MRTLTICPPHYNPALEYDHGIVIETKPIRAAQRNAQHDLLDGNGLTFDDINFEHGRMHVEKRTGPWKKLDAPWFAADAALLRDACVQFLEHRVHIKHPHFSWAHRSRLMKVNARLHKLESQLQEQLDRMCCQYVDAKKWGVSAEELRSIEAQIEVRDAEIRFNRHALQNVIAICYKSWVLCEPCTQVAVDLGLSPVEVRQLLHKIRKLTPVRVPSGFASDHHEREAARMRARRATPEGREESLQINRRAYQKRMAKKKGSVVHDRPSLA